MTEDKKAEYRKRNYEKNKEARRQHALDVYYADHEASKEYGRIKAKERRATVEGRSKARESLKRSREKHKEARESKRKSERINNPILVRLRGVKARAKRQGREFTITVDDFQQLPTLCPILGIELNYDNDKQEDSSPSFDRIDNNKGYIPGNVQIISWKANNLKKDGALEDFKLLVKWLEEQE